MNLEELNDKQQEAVLYNDGPLLIIAGAGAGKTKTLTMKIAYLIDELKVISKSENVLPFDIPSMDLNFIPNFIFISLSS